MSERYVVLGLARPRAGWFTDVTRWASTAALPIEFVKCLAPDEARARLASGRRWSAFLVDAAAPGVDRDLLDAARAVGAAPLVISDPRVDRPWTDLGASGVLPHDLDADDLARALAEHARAVTRVTPVADVDHPTTAAPWRGSLVAVTGIGGAGTSTVAALLAHAFASDVREHGLVVLADLSLDADQAVLHDAGHVSPGLPELVDAHRLGGPEPDAIRRLTVSGGTERPYDLLLGLRHHRDWTALRPRAIAASLDGLRATYRTVIAEVDRDVEGERETGSPDVEERNALSRAGVAAADVVVIVGRSDVVGVHRLAGLVRELRRFGVPTDRLLPVVNRSPRSPRARAEITTALAELALDGADAVPAVHLPDRRRLDEVARTGAPWPAGLAAVIGDAVRGVVQRSSAASTEATDQPERIAPGSLGSFVDLESDAS